MGINKKYVIEAIKMNERATDVSYVDDANLEITRHVCKFGSKIELLPRRVFLVPTPYGTINVGYYKCEKCGKVIIERNW